MTRISIKTKRDESDYFFDRLFLITSSAQLSAAETVGKPIVLVSNINEWYISSGFAPASKALLAWEWTEPSDLMAAEAAS